MKCPLCESRKGKRRCPAITRDICPACCGEKRIVEIHCEPTCPFLAEGQRNEIGREWGEYLRHQEPAKARLWLQVVEHMLPVIQAVEKAIVGMAGTLRDLADTEAGEALEALRQGYSAEESGIIYQPSSASPRVQAVVAAVRDEVEALRKAAAEGGQGSVPASAIAHCLEALRDRLEFHASRPGVVPFVEHLRRVAAPADWRGAGNTPSRLLIP